jgi:hypothetical protein
MYLFLYMALGLNDFEAGKSITRPIVRVRPRVMNIGWLKITKSRAIKTTKLDYANFLYVPPNLPDILSRPDNSTIIYLRSCQLGNKPL